MAKSDLKLKRWYLKWNRDYFGGSLPEVTQVFWEPVIAGVAEVQDSIVPAVHSRDDAGNFVIRIDPCLRAFKCLWGMALLHEMAHIEVDPYPGHGKKFQEVMLRLAQAGAFKRLW